MTVHYGDAFQGIKNVSLSTDGKTLRGEFDGRQILPFRVGNDPNSLKFADGRPPPQVKVDSDLADAMKDLEQQALKGAAGCSPPPPPPPPQEVGHDSHSDILLSGGCIKCRAICIGVTPGCLALCALTFFGYAACAAACAWVELNCLLDCSDPGEGCCPVSCGGKMPASVPAAAALKARPVLSKVPAAHRDFSNVWFQELL